jgi:ketosteroid isomerase-like protein
VNELEHRLRLYFKALNAFDLKSVEGLFAEDAVYVSSGLSSRKSGRAEIMASFKEYFDEFADQVSVDANIKMIAPNSLSSDWSLRATSRKTGKILERVGTQVTTFNAEGLIAHVVVGYEE